MTPNLYCYPILPRNGIGNKLFPWARAIICVHKYGLNMLAPRWVQLKIGTFFRKERDKRFYIGVFTNKGYIGGIKKLKVLLISKRIKEEVFLSKTTETIHAGKPIVIFFSGIKNFFYDLKGYHRLIKKELRNIVHPKWLRPIDQFDSRCIVVHVRRGDFTLSNIYTPIEWFKNVIMRLKEEYLIKDIPIFLVSDGRPEGLKPLLDIKGIKIISTFNSAIVDFLKMSKASLLIASKGSSFSSWASFIGRMPTIYPPGTKPQKLFDDKENIFEGELDPQDKIPELLKVNLQEISISKRITCREKGF